jgi:hypothetical protein
VEYLSVCCRARITQSASAREVGGGSALSRAWEVCFLFIDELGSAGGRNGSSEENEKKGRPKRALASIVREAHSRSRSILTVGALVLHRTLRRWREESGREASGREAEVLVLLVKLGRMMRWKLEAIRHEGRVHLTRIVVVRVHRRQAKQVGVGSTRSARSETRTETVGCILLGGFISRGASNSSVFMTHYSYGRRPVSRRFIRFKSACPLPPAEAQEHLLPALPSSSLPP